MVKAKNRPEYFTGVTLDKWLSDTNNIMWAQTDPRFREALSVVLNEAVRAHLTAVGCSEARAFGRVEGYHLALDVMRSLGRKPVKPEPEIEATHDEPAERVWQAGDARD